MKTNELKFREACITCQQSTVHLRVTKDGGDGVFCECHRLSNRFGCDIEPTYRCVHWAPNAAELQRAISESAKGGA